MKYILGIDQGGTKTAAAIIDENGHISGAGYAEGAYFPKQGMEYALANIKIATNSALAKAHLDISDIDHITAGITGVDYPGDDALLQNALEKIFPQKDICVYNDAVIALYSGTLKGYGAVICAGTGLNAAIRQKNGDCFVFGDYLGEELQGGSAIAHRGARVVFDTKLGIRHAEKLTELFLNFSKADTVDDLLRMYMQDQDFVARLKLIVPGMIDLAISGDMETDQLLFQFAKELGVYITTGLKNAALLQEPIHIVLAGSVFKGKHNPLVKYLTQYIQKAAPQAVMINAKYEPVAGACIMGLLQVKSFTSEMERNLSESAEKMTLLRK